MSDDDDFWGKGSKLKQPEKYSKIISSASHSEAHSPSKSHSPEISPRTPSPSQSPADSRSPSPQPSHHSNSSAESRKSVSGSEDEEAHEDSRVSGGLESEEEGTEEDPLSDVWDSGEEDEDDEESLEEVYQRVINAKNGHEIVTVKTGRGDYQEIDLTPPGVLLEEAERARKVYYRKRMEDECVKEAIRCIALTRILYKDRAPWKSAWAEAWMAKAYWELKQYPAQTHQHAEEARKELDRVEMISLAAGETPPEKAELLETALLTYYLLGKAHIAQKQPKEAEAALHKAEAALSERKALGGMKDGNFWRTEVYTALGRVKMCQEQPVQALVYLRKVEKLLERKFGPDSTQLMLLHQEMSKTESSRGDEEGFENAVEHSMKAYSIAKSLNEENSVEVGEAAQHLALAYAKLEGEEAEIYAESYLNEAIGCFQLALGNPQLKTLKARELLAKQVASKGRAQEAETILSEAIPHYIAAFGELSSRTCAAFRLLAGFCLQAGHTTQGAKNLKKVVHLETQIYGKSNARTQATQQALSVLLKNPKLEKQLDRGNVIKDRPRFLAAAKATDTVETWKRLMED